MILATLCYVKRGGRTLMLQRGKKADDIHQGKWNGLGGKMIPGETPEACVIREVREESGLEIRRPKLRGLLTFPNFNGGHDWYAFVFTAEEFDGEPVEECDEGCLEWIEDKKLLDLPLWEGDRFFLRWIEENRFFSACFFYESNRLLRREVVFYPAPAHS